MLLHQNQNVLLNNDLVYNDDDVYLTYFDCQDLFVYNISYV